MTSATKPTFWDVDTQIDFMMPTGKLYVPGAETILPNLRRLTEIARANGIQILGSVDHHSETDPELSESPDFETTFPPHCLAGTPGAEKVPETAPERPLWIPNDPMDVEALKQAIHAHDGEIFCRKQRFDVFTNPNVPTLLETLRPRRLVVYGVALDICDAFAIEGFLMRDVPVSLVLDATQPLDPERGKALVQNWKRRGVRIISTSDALAGRWEG